MLDTSHPSNHRDIPEAYERDGYVILRGVLDEDLMHEARNHVSWLMERHPGTRPEQLHNDLMQDDPFWLRLVADERLLDAAEAFVGDDIALFASHYIAKPPHDGQAVLWHQDGGFWPLEPMRVVSFWLALDPTDEENGCLRVVPGTHELDLKEMHERADVDNVLGSEMDLSFVDADAAVDIELAPGDIEIHHPNLIHGSHANTSPRWRRGLTIRYIPATTRILTDEPFPSAFFLRGTPAEGVNVYQPWPTFDPERHMPFQDVEAWNERARAHNERYSAHLAKSSS